MTGRTGVSKAVATLPDVDETVARILADALVARFRSENDTADETRRGHHPARHGDARGGQLRLVRGGRAGGADERETGGSSDV